MNREIEFRAWDGEVMVYEGVKGFVNYLHSYEILRKYETVMQFTGLKDKNGKKIYEDDIVKSNYGIQTVIYEDGGFSPFSIAGWECTPKWSECEIIGNIHENI